MANAVAQRIFTPEGLTDNEYSRFRRILHDVAGIRLGPHKKALICGRLAKRLRDLGLSSYSNYLDLIESSSGTGELQYAIDRLTTNETFFFREPKHFEMLRESLGRDHWPKRPLRAWSAACSSGEEVYTIAMVLAEQLGGDGWEVFGSDLSTAVLQTAERGVYPAARSDGIPQDLLRRFCLRGVRSQEGYFAVGHELRRRVSFRQINLRNPLPNIGQFDLVFLRNVMIYFDEAMKRQVVQRVVGKLRSGGYFFVGHAETLNGFSDDLELVAPTVYRKV